MTDPLQQHARRRRGGGSLVLRSDYANTGTHYYCILLHNASCKTDSLAVCFALDYPYMHNEIL